MKNLKNNRTIVVETSRNPALLTYEEWVEQSRNNPVIINYNLLLPSMMQKNLCSNEAKYMIKCQSIFI